MENLQLIDVLSEDDFLIASPLRNSLEDFRVSVLENIDEDEDLKLIGIPSSGEAENAAEMLEDREQLLLSESMVSGRASNFRKSFAWDSAFFTSAGVLDTEELFIINKGFEKAGAHLLPVTQKDARKQRSVESESKLGSDGFSFESNQSIEVDLFEDIRASIQRSSILPNVLKLGCKSGVGEARKRKTHCKFVVNGRALKKPDIVSQNRLAVKSGESELSFLKPAKVLGRMNPVPLGQTRKVCLGAYDVKMENKTATSGFRQGLILSKKSGKGYSCGSTSSTSMSSSFSISFTASNDSTDSCSPPGSASSFKSSSNSRRRIDSRKTRPAATRSTSKTPLRCSLGGECGLGKPGLPTHLLSMSDHSSYASPADSIDGLSSESSTCPNHRANCLEASFDTRTPKGASFGIATQASGLQSNSHDQLFGHQESHQTIEEVARTGNASAGSTRNFRPSGLRMPSPKIGFFDEEKSPVLSVSGGLQLHFGAQSALPNINVATDTKRQELAKNSTEVSRTLGTLRKFPVKASKVQSDMSPQLCRENCSKSRKVGNGVDTRKLVLHSSLKTERKRTEGILKNEMSRESKRHVCLKVNRPRPAKDDHLVHTEDINSSKKEKGSVKGHHFGNDRLSLLENEKENLPSFEDHVHGLSKYFEAMDLSNDTVIEINEKKGCSHHPNSGHDFTENDSAPLSSTCSGEFLLCRQQVSPKMSSKIGSLPSVSRAFEIIPNSRSPLRDINSVQNGVSHLGLKQNQH